MITAAYFITRDGEEHSYAVNRAGITQIEACGTKASPRLRIWAGEILLEEVRQSQIVECGLMQKEEA